MTEMSEQEEVRRWLTIVEKEVAGLKLATKTKVTDDIARVWASNRQKIKMSTEDQVRPAGPLQTIPMVSLSREPSGTSSSGEDGERKKRKREYAKVFSEKTNCSRTQVAEISQLPEVENYPKMNTWAPIKRNILTEDDNPINIPYFGDAVIDEDSNFIGSFEENVRQNMKLFEDDDEDTLYLKLVDNLAKLSIKERSSPGGDSESFLRKPTSEYQKLWHLQSSQDKTLPSLMVFQAIASKYPDYGSAEELIKRWRKIQDEKTGSNLVANIDETEAVAVSSERALHSYKSLLCNRCFIYDCPLHNDERVEGSLRLPGREADEDESPGPCGDQCYLHLPSVRSVMTPRSLNISTQSPFLKPDLAQDVCRKIMGAQYYEQKLVRWVDSEITLFRLSVQNFSSNWCAIAQVMMTKSCRQIFEFSKGELGSPVIKKRSSLVETPRDNKNKKKTKTKTKQAALYKGHSQGGEREDKSPYTPCHHPGQPCSANTCSCYQAGNFCEKFCHCSVDCQHRWPGCKCKSKCTTNACSCSKAQRECDPDLCSSCLDGRLEWDPATNTCRNVMIQRELGKKLIVAPSDIAGWGCFIGEKTDKNEFIAEYVGELISQDESDRRGKIYDKAKCSYMFQINEEFCVDAARMGGKIRFANHSSKPNCLVKILRVNGDHRIGIYANKNLEEGEELFFNYGKDFQGHF